MESVRIAFVDLQGFVDNGEFIVKELNYSIYSAEKKLIQNHYIFAAPYSWDFVNKSCRRQAKWLLRNQHGIHWSDGSISYDTIPECVLPLLEHNTTIYVKGAQKVEWFQSICNTQNNCINIEDIGCSIRIRELHNCANSDFCSYHTHLLKYTFENVRKFMTCAFRNVNIIADWYFNINTHKNKNE